MSARPVSGENRPRALHGVADHNTFRRRSWGNWLLLATTFVVTAAGLGAAIGTLLPNRAVNPWPWVRTDITLVAACVLLVLTFVLHLSREQRKLNRLSAELIAHRDEVSDAARRRVYALLNVSRMMGQHNKPESVFACITESCLEAFASDRASLMLYDETTQKLVVRAANDRDSATNMVGAEQPINEGVAGWAARNKKALILGREKELPQDPSLKLTSRSLVAAMVVPIILRDELVGVINVSSRSPDIAYQDEDLRALEVFAQNAGACIRHAEQSEWMRQTIETLRRHTAKARETETV